MINETELIAQGHSRSTEFQQRCQDNSQGKE